MFGLQWAAEDEVRAGSAAARVYICLSTACFAAANSSSVRIPSRRRSPSSRRRRNKASWSGVFAGAVDGAAGSAAGTVGFASAVYVSTSLAGGEPFVIYSHQGKDLVYSSHEGTTHIDRTYLTTPGSACDSACIKYSTGIGSAAAGAGAILRPPGAARLLNGNAASSADSAGFMVATMLVPTGE